MFGRRQRSKLRLGHAVGVVCLTAAGWCLAPPAAAIQAEAGKEPGKEAGKPDEKKFDPVPPVPGILNRKHLLGPGDAIDITVAGFPDLSKSVTLFADGTFEYPPYVPLVVAAGRTTQELQDYLQEELKRELRRPRVTVSLKSVYVPPPPPPMQAPIIKIWAYGLVGRKGPIEITRSQPLREVLATVNPLPEADLSNIRVKYPDGTYKVCNFSDFTLTGMSADDIQINGGEEIYFLEKPYVPKAEPVRFKILGSVATPGPMTTETSMELLEALRRAGGAGPSADLKRVKVEGPNHKEPKFVDVDAYSRGDLDANYVIQQGDIITVADMPLKILVVGETGRPGEQFIRPGDTLFDIYLRSGATGNADRNKIELIRTGPKGKPETKSYKVDDFIKKKKVPETLVAGDVVYFPPKSGGGRGFFHYLNAVANPVFTLRTIFGFGGFL